MLLEFSKPAASCPTSKTTNTPKKKGGDNRPPKGQNNSLKIYNKYGSLEDDTGMEVEASRTSLPSSLSGSTSSLPQNGTVLQWNIRGLKENFEELRLLCRKYNLQIVAVQECQPHENKKNLNGFSGITTSSPGNSATVVFPYTKINFLFIVKLNLILICRLSQSECQPGKL